VTVVGVLVEVPVMLSLVALANRTRRHFPAQAEAASDRVSTSLGAQEARQ
jgi:ACR3 family arsenite transporter